MNSFLTILGLFIIAYAFRSCRKVLFRKIGALAYLVLSGLVVYCATDSILFAMLGMLVWFVFPLVEIIGKVGKLKFPLDNKLKQNFSPNEDMFPNADASIAALEDAGFEYAGYAGWDWSCSSQSYRFFWHPEERSVAAVCFCKQSKITFSFLTILSRDHSGTLWRTTNYPFSQMLKNPPSIWQNNIPCAKKCIHEILASHHDFIALHGACHDDLIIPNPNTIDQDIEQDMRVQIEHNLNASIIKLTGDGHFKYSMSGLLFLWKQSIKDLIRLC